MQNYQKAKRKEKISRSHMLGPDARDESKCFLCPKFQSLQHSYSDFHFPKLEIKAQCDYLVFHESSHEEQRLGIQSESLLCYCYDDVLSRVLGSTRIIL